jgi:hypothetical protein
MGNGYYLYCSHARKPKLKLFYSDLLGLRTNFISPKAAI